MAHFTIDVSNKKLGRVATEIAMILRGKNDPSFAPHKLSGNTVTVTNASQIDLTGARLADMYKRFSGYPSGQKLESRAHMIARLGFEPIFKHAVKGMLPNNRLRDIMLKNLTITG